MDDKFMHGLRRDPDPGFAARLRQRLARQSAPAERASRRPFRFAPAFGAAIAAGVVALLFVFPSVRDSAQAVLDLFRVRNFAPVSFDPKRMEQFRELDRDNAMLIFDRREVLEESGKPLTFDTPLAASGAAGFPVRTPSNLPEGWALKKVAVEGRAAMRFTADPVKLRALLDALDVRDVEVPLALAGQWITVRKPPIVFQQYGGTRREAQFIQAPSPQVDLPAGAQLSQLAEIGMRVLGVERAEASRLARTVDWHSTLLVPVPTNAGSFRSVHVNGESGLLVAMRGQPDADGKRRHQGNMLLWSSNDRVYAIMGNIEDREIVLMAESVR